MFPVTSSSSLFYIVSSSSYLIFFYIFLFFFFFNDTATTEIYTLSLHDALPICFAENNLRALPRPLTCDLQPAQTLDRKSTRLNSSHGYISYAVFCLKKKKKKSMLKSSPSALTTNKTKKSLRSETRIPSP